MEANPWFCTKTTISLTPDGGSQLLRHQVGAVADHDEDVAVVVGVQHRHLDAEPTWAIS